MVKISVVIITYNEENNISRCLDTLKEVADDIVVVDSFSTDKTGEICRTKNVRFVQHVFKGHIEQKNYAITQAKYFHILSLDADEALCEKLQEEILKVKNDWRSDGYYINRLTSYSGKWIRHCGWYPDRKLRLWDSRKGRWGGINPHDKFEMVEGSVTSNLKGDILHYSFYSIKDHITQVNKFTDISSEAMLKMGKRSNLLKIIIYPIVKFIRDYFLKLGFLDGFYGLVICIISAHAKFLKYAKAYDRSKY